MFSDVVAQARHRWHEDHRCRTDPLHHLRIVARPRRHAPRAEAERAGMAFHAVDQSRVEDDRLEPCQDPGLNIDPLLLRDLGTCSATRASDSFSLASSVLRRSTVNTARLGTTLIRLGLSDSAPTVAT